MFFPPKLQDAPCGSEKEFCKKYSCYDYPIEVVELPDEPDGKKFEVFFEREGQVEASTQTTRPVTVIIVIAPLYVNVSLY